MAEYSAGAEQYEDSYADNFTGANGAEIEQRSGDATAIVSSANPAVDDEEKRKIFVGGLSWETTVTDLRQYFATYGDVVDCTLKTDVATGRSRGFGFVTFSSVEPVEKVLTQPTHTLQGRNIDPKRAMPRGTQEPIKKIFVGGLDVDVPEKTIRDHFSKYGKVEEIDLPFDKIRSQRRQFCFVTFDSEDAVEKAIKEPVKEMEGGKQIDVKKATPKGGDGQGRGRGGGYGAWGDQSGYNQGWGSGYDSSYYNQGGYGGGYDYYNQGGYGGYDYNNYYNQGWGGQGYGGYGGYGSGYGGYDYSGWYGQNQQQGSSDYSQGNSEGGQSGGSQGNYKAPKSAATPSSSTTTPGYHPYQR